MDKEVRVALRVECGKLKVSLDKESYQKQLSKILRIFVLDWSQYKGMTSQEIINRWEKIKAA